jgi:hypothetical protein
MDSNKKLIGVFGDSYADLNPHQYIDESLGRMPWPMWLQKFSNSKVECYGVSATSIWYSYKKFLANYKKYDTIVFCYSDLHRWYNINDPEGLHRGLYHIRYHDQLKVVPTESMDDAKILVDSYKLLHDWDLDKFLFQSVFNSINMLCDEAGINIVNILNFEEINNTPLSIDITTNNIVITNLVQVSGREYLHPDGNAKFKDITKLMSSGADKRFCHMNPHNNRVLAETIIDCMENNITYVNLGNHNKFSYEYEDIKYLLELD